MKEKINFQILKRQILLMPEKIKRSEEILRLLDDDAVNFAEKNFGYTLPAIQEMKKAEVKTCLPLTKHLREAGIRPFTCHSVIKYQKKVKGDVGRPCLIVGIILFFLSCIFCIGFFCFHTGILSIISSLLFIICFFAGISNIVIAKSGRWEDVPFDHSYILVVPSFALKTVKEIKTRCNTAIFFISGLQSPYYKKIISPFLIVKAGNEQYYLEVWNEPNNFYQQRPI